MEAPGHEPDKPSLVERLRDQRTRHRDRHLVVRVLFVVTGFTVLLGGLAMLVLPGPAFAVIPIGLGLLSLEFFWAEQAMEKALEQAEKAKTKASATTPTQRWLLIGVTVCAIAAAVTAALVWDIPGLPF
jgi:uncharacterized protein (TIGR02611 family)